MVSARVTGPVAPEVGSALELFLTDSSAVQNKVTAERGDVDLG